MNINQNLKQINKMKNKLIKDGTTLFTRKEFMNHTSISQYYFSKALKAGLIIDTGNAFTNKQGAPTVYTLADAFLSHTEIKNKYTLTQEDVDLLLNNKKTRITRLNNSINTMQNQINELKNQQSKLIKVKIT